MISFDQSLNLRVDFEKAQLQNDTPAIADARVNAYAMGVEAYEAGQELEDRPALLSPLTSSWEAGWLYAFFYSDVVHA